MFRIGQYNSADINNVCLKNLCLGSSLVCQCLTTKNTLFLRKKIHFLAHFINIILSIIFINPNINNQALMLFPFTTSLNALASFDMHISMACYKFRMKQYSHSDLRIMH